MAKAAPQIAATQVARKYNSDMLLMASPWSAPAWMKSNNSLIKGTLNPAHYALCRPAPPHSLRNFANAAQAAVDAG